MRVRADSRRAFSGNSKKRVTSHGLLPYCKSYQRPSLDLLPQKGNRHEKMSSIAAARSAFSGLIIDVLVTANITNFVPNGSRSTGGLAHVVTHRLNPRYPELLQI